MQDDYNELVERMTNVNVVGQDLQFLIDEAKAALLKTTTNEVVDYMQTNMESLVERCESY